MSDNAETAILAGGCAWIMQQLLRHPDGVISTRTGWTGGESDDPTEERPGGHAEVVEVMVRKEQTVDFRREKPGLHQFVGGRRATIEHQVLAGHLDDVRRTKACGCWRRRASTEDIYLSHVCSWDGSRCSGMAPSRRA